MERTECNVNDVYSAIVEMVSENIDENERILAQNIKEAGDDCANELKSTSPRRTGEYASGWKNNFRGGEYGHAVSVIANHTKPSLTHLLENGHELFYMGHDTGRRTRAFKHIEPAYEHAADELKGEGVD